MYARGNDEQETYIHNRSIHKAQWGYSVRENTIWAKDVSPRWLNRKVPGLGPPPQEILVHCNSDVAMFVEHCLQSASQATKGQF